MTILGSDDYERQAEENCLSFLLEMNICDDIIQL